MCIFSKLYWFYIFTKTFIRVKTGSKCIIGKKVKIKNCKIYLLNNSILEIKDGSYLDNIYIYINNGECIIGENAILQSNTNKSLINIDQGSFRIGHHSSISAKRVWIRFNGRLTIGNYTNINSGSEIRCDEEIKIGNYNQISYNVNIWDTNTHNILTKDERRQLTEFYYPYFGKELKKPKTKRITIGDDCWIGQNVSILKGTEIGNEVIVGYNCIISNKSIIDNKTVVSDINLKLYDNNI
jgi:acetyltransferase-like isoleucine patch superfamily enzyme